MACSNSCDFFYQKDEEDGGTGGDGSGDEDDDRLVAPAEMRNQSMPEPSMYGWLT